MFRSASALRWLAALVPLCAACSKAPPPPARPATPAAAASPNGVLVTWPAVAGAEKYDVRVRRTDDADPPVVVATTPAQQYLHAASPGSDLAYSVRARSASGESAWSDEAAVLTLPAAVAPAAAAGDGQVALSWQAAKSATSYRVSRANGAGAFAELATTAATQLVDPAAANGNVWKYRLEAINATGAGPAADVTAHPDPVWVVDRAAGQVSVFPQATDGSPVLRQFGNQTRIASARSVAFSPAGELLAQADDGLLVAFPALATGNVAPTRAARAMAASAIAVDAPSGRLVAAGVDGLKVYGADFSGPLRTVSVGDARGLAIDEVNREIFVGRQGAVDVFSLDALLGTGPMPMLRSITGAATGIVASPLALAFDAVRQQLAVVVMKDSVQSEVLFFERLAGRDTAPVRRLTSTLLVFSMAAAFDAANDELWLGSSWGAMAFAGGADGQVEPLRRIRGGVCVSQPCASPLWSVGALAVKGAELVVGEANPPGGVYVWPRTASGDVAPARAISGASAAIPPLPSIACDGQRRELFLAAGEVVVHAAGASGAATPLRRFTPRVDSGDAYANAVAIEPTAGRLVVGTSSGLLLYPLAASGDAPQRIDPNDIRSVAAGRGEIFALRANDIASFTAAGAQVRSISLPAGSRSGPERIAYDPVADAIVLVDTTGAFGHQTVKYFRRTDEGAAAPSKTLTNDLIGYGQVRGMAVDPVTGELWLTPGERLKVWAANASGADGPIRHLDTPANPVRFPVAVTFCP